jgi:hypothetical protein
MNVTFQYLIGYVILINTIMRIRNTLGISVDQKHLKNFEMWCWRRMEISWTDHVEMKYYLESRRTGIPYMK